MRAIGFDGAPLPIEIQSDGRERLEFLEGEVPQAPYPEWTQLDAVLASATELLRRFHEASRTVGMLGTSWSGEMADPLGGTIICHNDVYLSNIVFRDRVAVGLLDFDFAAPGRALFDVTQFARLCVPVDDDVNARRLGWFEADRPARLRLVADAYGLDEEERGELVSSLTVSMDQAEEFVRRRVDAGDSGFISAWNDMGGEERFDRRRRWWRDHKDRFAQALR